MLKEFKEFISKGNLVEIAVGLILALAFAGLVASFTESLISPIIGAIFGQPNFDRLVIEMGDAELRYGAFLTSLIQFVAIATAVFFFVVKPLNELTERLAGPADEGTPDEERRHQELLAALEALRR